MYPKTYNNIMLNVKDIKSNLSFFNNEGDFFQIQNELDSNITQAVNLIKNNVEVRLFLKCGEYNCFNRIRKICKIGDLIEIEGNFKKRGRYRKILITIRSISKILFEKGAGKETLHQMLRGNKNFHKGKEGKYKKCFKSAKMLVLEGEIIE